MKRAIKVVVALLAVQVLFVGVYFAVEGRRSVGGGAGGDTVTGSAPTAPLPRPAPELTYETRADGLEHHLSALRGRPLVLHFWATWCLPCREELPELLAFGDEAKVRVLAVSVDPDWKAVEEFFDGEPPSTVVRADADAVGAFAVTVLPVTYVVDGSGDLRLRLSGARDWSKTTVRTGVLDALGER